MSRSKITRLISVFLSIIITWTNVVFSSLPQGVSVSTPSGLVPVEKLKVGDKVLSYDFNTTDTKKALVEVAITKIDKHLLECGFTIYTGKYRWIDTSPQQLFFVLKATHDKKGNLLALADFVQAQLVQAKLVQAQHLNVGDMLIDVNMSYIPITKIKRADCCATKKNKNSKIIEIKAVKIYAYAIEVEKSLCFIVSENSWGKDVEPHLLLTRNGAPEC